MNWISVEDLLPTIPEGKHAVEVLVTVFDECYEELNPGHGSHVTTAIYSTVYKDGEIHPDIVSLFGEDVDFTDEPYMFLTWASGSGGVTICPFFDEITHWMYYPELPQK